jgi:phenylpropionate dioxygenase-like ring-hydroxylating dioxygenase large terminal subunit
MGNAMRRYWLPALLSSELPEPEGDPRHVQLLGQDLVAFRDTEGKVGILDELCCHRGASLLLGRVEDRGIRCIYHGWKFAADGTVLDTPNVSDPRFKERIKAPAYPVQEAGGIIWTYLGPKDKCPPFPQWPFFDVPQSNRLAAYPVVNANYVQVLEGLVDSSHLNLLHTTGMASTGDSSLDFAAKVSAMQEDAAPQIEAEETEFGFHYCALRSGSNGEGTLARITAFVAPCFIFNPNGDLWFAVVPVNDHQTNFIHVWWDKERRFGEEPLYSDQLRFVGLDQEALAAYCMNRETCDSAERPRKGNRYLQNREAIRSGKSFTGLHSFTQEDAAVAISAGAIRDRAREKLAPADAAIVRLYRSLLKLAELQGESATDLDISSIKGVVGTIAPGQPWQSLVPDHVVLGRRSTSGLRKAASKSPA